MLISRYFSNHVLFNNQQPRPQSSTVAIKYLIQESETSALCYDAQHEELVNRAVGSDAQVQRLMIPWDSLQSLNSFQISLPTEKSTLRNEISSESIAFYFHSSGTAGIPKLISQTHHGAVGVLPLLQEEIKDTNNKTLLSTFTTTPLYHGGIADIFRHGVRHPLYDYFQKTKFLSSGPMYPHVSTESMRSIELMNL